MFTDPLIESRTVTRFSPGMIRTENYNIRGDVSVQEVPVDGHPELVFIPPRYIQISTIESGEDDKELDNIYKNIDSDKVYSHYWQDLEEKWWRQDVRQGRIVRPRIDVFLNYWLIARQKEVEICYLLRFPHPGQGHQAKGELFDLIGHAGGGHRGIDEPRRETIHRDVRSRILQGQGAGQTDDPRLAGRVIDLSHIPPHHHRGGVTQHPY